MRVTRTRFLILMPLFAVGLLAAERPAAEPAEPLRFGPNAIDLSAPAGEIWSVALSPDGKTLAVASGMWDKPGALTLRDVPTGKVRLRVQERLGLRGVAFAPDGKTLATADYFDKTAKVRDAATGRVQRVLGGHKEGVNGVAFAPDGQTLATAGLDKTIKLWDPATGQLKATLEGQTAGVFSVAFVDSKTLLSGGGDGTGRVWDLATGKVRFTLQGHKQAVECVAASPDGKTLATGSWDKTVKLWDAATGKQTATLEGHAFQVLSLAFAPDGKTLAAGSGRWSDPAPPGSPNGGEIKLWDVASHKEIASLKGHSDRVFALAFGRDGLLASGGWDKTMKLWDAAGRKERATFSDPQGPPPSPVLALAVSPDGKTLAVAGEDKLVRLEDARTGEVRAVLEGHDDVVAGLAFSPDGRTLASAGWDQTIKLWDLASNKVRHTLTGHTNPVFAVAFTPDGKTLASGGYDKLVRLWDVAGGKLLTALRGHRAAVRCLAFTPDGQTLVTGGSDRSVKLWDVAKREVKETLKGHEDVVRALAIAPDGKTLATGGEDGTLRLWELPTGKSIATQTVGTPVQVLAFSPRGRTLVAATGPILSLRDPHNGGQRTMLSGHADVVTATAFAPDGQTIFTGSADRTVKRWPASFPAIEARTTLPAPASGAVVAVLSPDGRFAATAGTDKTLRVRPVQAKPSPASSWEVANAHAEAIHCAAFSADGKLLATGGADQTVRLWDTANGALRAVHKRQSSAIHALAFAPDGKTLAVAGEDKTVKLWDVATGDEKATLPAQAQSVDLLVFSPDSKMLAICGDGTKDKRADVQLWDTASRSVRTRLTTGLWRVGALAFAPDGKTLVAGGRASSLVQSWDTATGSELFRKNAEPEQRGVVQPVSVNGTTVYQTVNQRGPAGVRSLGFDREGRRLALGLADGTLRVWESIVWQERGSATQRGAIQGAAFAPDGKTLATIGQDGAVTLWGLPTMAKDAKPQATER